MNYTSTSLIILLLGHWFGDYLLQTSTMASQKSSSLYWLTLHVLVYTLTLAVFSFFVLSFEIAWHYALWNGLFHWLTDFVTSKLTATYSDRPRIFYPLVGFDQFLHVTVLVLTLQG